MAGITFDGIPSTEKDSTILSGTTLFGTNGSFVNLNTGSLNIITPVTSAELGSGTVLSANISGAQVLSTHIASGAVLSAQISGGQVLTTHIQSGGILTPNISGAQISGNVVSLEYPTFKGLGSPAITNLGQQAGSNTTSAGSQVWVLFPLGFAVAPQVVIGTVRDTATFAAVSVGSINAGSALFYGPASTAFNWYAAGSGRL